MKHLIAGACCVLALAVSASARAADAKNGATVFNRCIICHSNSKGAPAKIGPNLFGVVGRKAGTAPSFNYSAAMKGSGIVWTDDKLKTYLAHPAQVVPGTKMTFAGISNPRDVDDVVAYLNTLK
jgi:cytochrome c